MFLVMVKTLKRVERGERKRRRGGATATGKIELQRSPV